MNEATFKPFNANNVEPNGGDFDLIPKGDYKMVIVKSAYKAVKSGKGCGLNLEMDILDGSAKGRKHFEWLNIEHTDEQTQQIGQGRLSAICRAVNVLDLRDPGQLHDLPFVGTMDIRVDKKSGEERNTIKAFKSLSGKVSAKTPVNKDVTSKYEVPKAAPNAASLAATASQEVRFDDDDIPF